MWSDPSRSSFGLSGEAIAGNRGHDEMERVFGAAAMRCRIGERPDHLHDLEDRAGPAVRHDHRQGVRVAGTDVDELNVEPVDFGHEHCGNAFSFASTLRQS